MISLVTDDKVKVEQLLMIFCFHEDHLLFTHTHTQSHNEIIKVT